VFNSLDDVELRTSWLLVGLLVDFSVSKIRNPETYVHNLPVTGH
jgi:hypothetical protein